MVLRIVGIGGGTGLPVLLRGLSRLARDSGAACASGVSPARTGRRQVELASEERASTEHFEALERAGAEIEVSAIVCVSDNGGSSGLLRQAFGIPAVGDLRNCLVGLSGEDALLADLFQYRFPAGDGLTGHALGNLILTALYQRSGSLRAAVQSVAELLRLKGNVFPATEEKVTLCARFAGGRVARGECEIARAGRRIERLWLEPEGARATDEALASIAAADAIVLGPGSLYTSVLPNLLVAGVAEAVRRAPAVKIFSCNLMTEPGETDGFTAADHLQALEEYLGPGVLRFCLVNSTPIDSARMRAYREGGASPVATAPQEVHRHGVTPVCADLLAEGRSEARHDPMKLAHLVVALSREGVGRPLPSEAREYALSV